MNLSFLKPTWIVLKKIIIINLKEYHGMNVCLFVEWLKNI